MSIASMATGSTIIPQTPTNTRGSAGGNTRAWANGSSIDCNVQDASDRTHKQFDTRGQKRLYEIYFGSDPNLTEKQRVKITQIQGRTLASARFARVLALGDRGNPSGSMAIWRAVCEEVTSRRES